MPSSVRQIIAIYCVCDDFLSARGHKDAPQAKLTTAQVMTIALVASALFCGNQDKRGVRSGRVFLQEHSYIQPMLSKGCLNRRLHEVPETLWQALFALLAQVHQGSNQSQQYAVDSMPAVVCDTK